MPHSAAASIAPWEQPISRQDTSAEFAPNAFSTAPQYAQPFEGPRWYDRIVDALLGEDESSPKNRIALICDHCRLVNGQAPPGVKTLEDIGKWRCSGCGTMNGKVSTKKLVASIEKELASEKAAKSKRRVSFAPDDESDKQETDGQSNADHESDITQYSDESEDDRPQSEKTIPAPKAVTEAEAPRRRSTRSTANGKKR